MNIVRLIALLLVCASTGALAEERASRESVDELMELMQASKMIDAMYDQVGQMFEGMAEQMGVTEADRPAFDKYMKKVAALMQKEMSWEKIREPTIEIYIRNFSEEEVRGMIDFYGSDIGKSMITKMPIVMQESMGISQAMLKETMPKIQALAEELQSEIAASRKNSDAE